MKQTFKANGKLLLTAEYLVLHGAKAIALPLTKGQTLAVEEKLLENLISWQAFYESKIWFSCEMNPTDFSVVRTSHPEKAETLVNIFQTIRKLNPSFSPQARTSFETFLDANPEWGFGSSSTLISLLSQWAKVNPFELNEIIFKGSGFDIACATASGPIFYTKNQALQDIQLDYSFAGQLFLVYSGHKKATRQEVSQFLKNNRVTSSMIDQASALSDEFAACTQQNTFGRLMNEHEQLIGHLIGQVPVKDLYFHDFEGQIKSLGAWGGDFYLIESEWPLQKISDYFSNKGLSTLFKWNDLIMKHE
jgi:mevalonate kinase